MGGIGLIIHKQVEECRIPSKNKEEFLRGVKDCLPTVLGYVSIGFAAGVIEKASGFTMLEVALLSAALYAGSAQFIIAGMFVAGAPALAIIITIFFVNVRHLVMSAALSPYFKRFSFWKNVTSGILLTDETFSVAANEMSKKKEGSYYWMLGLNMTAYLYWIAANMIGALLGQYVSNPKALGLDFALVAMFIGLYVMQFVARRNVQKDVIVTVAAIILVVMAGRWISGNMAVLVGIVGAALVGVFVEKWK